MERKVVDIFPPTGDKRIFEERAGDDLGQKLPAAGDKKKPEHRRAGPARNPSFLSGKKFLIFLPAVLAFGFVAAYFTLSRAEVEIWPETENLVLTSELSIDKNAKEPQFPARIIPGEIFEKEKITSKNFAATGKAQKEEKAKGTITIYNEYSGAPQGLLAATRFVSADGKLFRIPSAVTVPGSRYAGGKLVPGEVKVEAVADQPGEDYNIGPSTFSVPGFAGTSKYTKFYAKSFEPMTGGLRETMSQVKAEDLDEAERSLVEKGKNDTENVLKNELKSGHYAENFYFLEEAVRTQTLEKSSLAKPGDKVENFNFQVKTKSDTLIFKKEDVENFVKDFINSQIPGGKKINEKKLKISFEPESIDFSGGKISLALKISTEIYSDINMAELKDELRGKTLAETRIFLENQPKVVKVKAQFWPFWVKKAPEEADKIKIKLMLESDKTSP